MENKEVSKRETAISTFVIFNTEIAEICESVYANLGDAALTGGDLVRIKVPAGGGIAWTIPGPEGDQMVKELEGIICHWSDTRAYWSVPMEQSEGNSAPDCSSVDSLVGIGTPGGNCHTCHLAEFGSDAKGEGQACKQVRLLYMIRQDNLLPEIIHLPPSSLKPARQYFMQLLGKRVPFYGVVTKISLEKTKNAQGIAYAKAVLTSTGRLTPEQAQKVKEYAAMIERLLKTTKNNTEIDGEVI